MSLSRNLSSQSDVRRLSLVLLSVQTSQCGSASATECLPVVVRVCSIKCCDAGAVSWILWEWACPPSGTVFHVMRGDIRKRMFLRHWGCCQVWIVLQGWSECVAWSVCALWFAVFWVTWCGDAASFVSRRLSLSHCGCSSESFSPWVSFQDHGLFMFLTFCVFFMFVCFSSDVNDEFSQHPFSESHVTRSFLVHPSETSCLCPTWNWQVQVLRGVFAVRLVHQCQPTSVLWLQRNSSDCVWTVSWADRAVIRYIYMVFCECLSNSWYSHGFQWVFELCVVGATFVKLKLFVRVCLNCVLGPLGLEMKPLMFTILRFLRWKLFTQKFYQKSCLNIIFSIRASGSFGLFVGQCVASLETSVMSSSGTPSSQSDVRRSSLVYSCEVVVRNESGKCNRTLAHSQDPFSHFGCSSDFYELIMFLARCRFFVFVRLIPCVEGQFIQHFLWRHTWQDHHRFISLRRHLSVRVLSATDRMLVVVRVCSIKCCDGGAACSIVWEWACPPSGTVLHVMLEDIRKHVFLRQWGWCEGWIILQV